MKKGTGRREVELLKIVYRDGQGYDGRGVVYREKKEGGEREGGLKITKDGCLSAERKTQIISLPQR